MKAKIYSTSWCPECQVVKRYFDKMNVEYEVINVADEQPARAEVFEISGQYTVPVTVIDDQVIVGWDRGAIDSAMASGK